jgi:hypothetical protein
MRTRTARTECSGRRPPSTRPALSSGPVWPSPGTTGRRPRSGTDAAAGRTPPPDPSPDQSDSPDVASLPSDRLRACPARIGWPQCPAARFAGEPDPGGASHHGQCGLLQHDRRHREAQQQCDQDNRQRSHAEPGRSSIPRASPSSLDDEVIILGLSSSPLTLPARLARDRVLWIWGVISHASRYPGRVAARRARCGHPLFSQPPHCAPAAALMPIRTGNNPPGIASGLPDTVVTASATGFGRVRDTSFCGSGQRGFPLE